jgi:hypothetical protein
VNEQEDQQQHGKRSRRRSLLRRCGPHKVTPTDIEISANLTLARSQARSVNPSPRHRPASEAKIEANPEGKIELGIEVLAGPLTTHLLA